MNTAPYQIFVIDISDRPEAHNLPSVILDMLSESCFENINCDFKNTPYIICKGKYICTHILVSRMWNKSENGI